MLHKLLTISILFGTLTQTVIHSAAHAVPKSLSTQERLEQHFKKNKNGKTSSLIFDLPVTYNSKVQQWLAMFQGSGQKWYRTWLERSYIYLPVITEDLKQAGLPQDLAYMVMIESGFSPNAVSTADAVGPWQFIQPTAERYGLKINWWLDERRDLKKSTQAAIRYIRDLHSEFHSWYLVAASYNMGENGLRRKIKKENTNDFWILSRRNALPQETIDYVPKILAAMMIAKAPNLYGFRDLTIKSKLEFDFATVPGGTNMDRLADHLGVTKKYLRDLNAELVLGYIPRSVDKHTIRIPKGSTKMVSEYIQKLNYKVAME